MKGIISLVQRIENELDRLRPSGTLLQDVVIPIHIPPYAWRMDRDAELELVNRLEERLENVDLVTITTVTDANGIVSQYVLITLMGPKARRPRRSK